MNVCVDPGAGVPPLGSLPKSELEVLRIVWDQGTATVRDVSEALPDERRVDFWTVQTYLRRLAEKGYLKVTKRGRTNVYSPAVQPEKVIRKLVDDFLQQMFDGEAVPLFQHLVGVRGLTESEIEQLQQTLNELKERKS